MRCLKHFLASRLFVASKYPIIETKIEFLFNSQNISFDPLSSSILLKLDLGNHYIHKTALESQYDNNGDGVETDPRLLVKHVGYLTYVNIPFQNQTLTETKETDYKTLLKDQIEDFKSNTNVIKTDNYENGTKLSEKQCKLNETVIFSVIAGSFSYDARKKGKNLQNSGLAFIRISVFILNYIV